MVALLRTLLKNVILNDSRSIGDKQFLSIVHILFSVVTELSVSVDGSLQDLENFMHSNHIEHIYKQPSYKHKLDFFLSFDVLYTHMIHI